MTSLLACVNWILFLLRNRLRKPPYPFEDDCGEDPLRLHVGAWGCTQWKDVGGDIYTVETIDDVNELAESFECSIYGWTYRECVENARRLDLQRRQPSLHKISFGKKYVGDLSAHYFFDCDLQPE